MNKGSKILVGLAIAALLTIGVAANAHAEEPAPADGWQQMWQWCHGGGSEATAYLNPTAAAQIAKLLGVTTQDLYTQRAAGASIADIAKTTDVSEQQLLDAALAPYRDSLALRVKYGYITQAQADQSLQTEEANLRAALTATGTTAAAQRPTGMMGPYGGFGGMMGGFGGMMGGFGGIMDGLSGMMGGFFGGRGMMGGWN